MNRIALIGLGALIGGALLLSFAAGACVTWHHFEWTPPRDEVMLRIFRANQTAFLAAVHRDSSQLERAFPDSKVYTYRDGTIKMNYAAGGWGAIGPGWYKSFVYYGDVLPDVPVLPALDQLHPRRGKAYNGIRPIARGWYLRYDYDP